MAKHRYDFPRYCTNTWNFGDSAPCVIIWVAGMTREEFEEWKEFVSLTVRTAERTILDAVPATEDTREENT